MKSSSPFFHYLKIGLLCFFGFSYISMVARNVMKRQARANATPIPVVAAPTARTLAPFTKIKKGMWRREVVAIVGNGDENIGGTLPIYLYKLSHGATIRIGYNPRRVMFVGYFPKTGPSRDLVENQAPIR
jgi:hypothetical protein